MKSALLSQIRDITPVTAAFAYKYIVIAVDYFSRFLFTAPVTYASGDSTVSLLLEQIVRPFGWPGSMYTDNGTHFVSRVFARLLQDNLVRHFPAPKTHPSSVGLSVRYVQILMTGLRTTIIQNCYPIERWFCVYPYCGTGYQYSPVISSGLFTSAITFWLQPSHYRFWEAYS